MRRRRLLMSLVAPALCLVALGGAWGADRPALVLDLPAEGRLAATVKAAYTALQPTYDLWWLKVHQPGQLDRKPAAMVLGSEATLAGQAGVDIGDFVRKGGGLVYVASMDSNARAAENEFLRGFGVRVATTKGQKQSLEVLPHAVTRDLGALPSPAMRAGLVADALEPVALVNGSPVAVAGMVGQGRVVVLAGALLVTADEAHAPGSPQARLLAQAAAWAAGQGLPPPGTTNGAGQAATTPPVAADLAQKILVDLPETPAWQQIVKIVTEKLGALNLPLEPLHYEAGKHTLADTLMGRPALLVLGSHRAIEDAELPALAEYVSKGGSVLALGYQTPEKGSIQFVISLNRALGEFGVTFTEGRPAGQGVLKEHPITKGLKQPGRIGAGGAVWAYADWPLVTAGDAAVASAHEFRQGRLVVMDAKALLPPGKKEKANSHEWFRELLLSAARWLTGR